MSDHVDGPRSVGDPSADLTDLFAFTSPENPTRTVLCACVFPSAGEDAIFSNVIDHSIAIRRVNVAGVGNAAKFQPADEETRFKPVIESLFDRYLSLRLGDVKFKELIFDLAHVIYEFPFRIPASFTGCFGLKTSYAPVRRRTTG